MQLISEEALKWFGLINIFFMVLVLLTCRCFVGTKTYLTLLQKNWFKKFYQHHCWYWWGFAISVAIHTTLALYIFGLPF